MNLWRPQIWTPFADRCPDCNRRNRRRRFNPLRFAAGDVLLDTSGNVILDDSGNVMLSDGAGDSCCCGGATPCSLCPDTTPKTFTVTFSGTTIWNPSTCWVCYGPIFNVAAMADTPGGATNFDGTYTLTQNASDPCRWDCCLAGYRFRKWFYKTTCTGTPDVDVADCSTPPGNLIYLKRLSGGFELYAGLNGIDGQLFYDSFFAATCAGTFNATNDYTSTGVPGCYRVGYGGTAVITG